MVQNIDAKAPGDALLVRGRVRADLEHFADFVARHGERPVIKATPHFDYGFRLTASRETLAAYLVENVETLDYPNFKDEVLRTDRKRAHVYMDVWAVLHKLGRTPA